MDLGQLELIKRDLKKSESPDVFTQALVAEVERCWRLLGMNQPAVKPTSFQIDDTVVIRKGYAIYHKMQGSNRIAFWPDDSVLTVATLETGYVWLFDGTYHGRVPQEWVQAYKA